MEGEGGGNIRVTESREEVDSGRVRVKNNNEEERNLFYHHLLPLSLLDTLVLSIAGIFLVPIRSSFKLCHAPSLNAVFRFFLALLVMLSAWLVSGLGLMFRDREAFECRPQVYTLQQPLEGRFSIVIMGRVVGEAFAGSLCTQHLLQ